MIYDKTHCTQKYWSTPQGIKLSTTIKDIGKKINYINTNEFVLDPLFVDYHQILDINGHLSSLYDILIETTKYYFNSLKEVLDYFGLSFDLPEYMLTNLDLLLSHSCPLRWDLIPTSKGFKVIEMNYGWALGGINRYSIQTLYNEHIEEFNSNIDPMYYLVERLNTWENKFGKRKWLICDSDYFFYKYQNFIKNLCDIIRSLDFQVRSLPLSELSSMDMNNETLIEVFTLFDLVEHSGADAYKEYIKRSQNLIFTSPFDAVWSCKGLFALIYKGITDGIYTNSQKELLVKMIPYTILLNIDNLVENQKNKNTFILKPISGLGGEGIVIGKDVSQEKWNDCLCQAIDSPHAFIIQEYIQPIRKSLKIIDFQDHIYSKMGEIVLGVFQMQRKYAGAMFRLGKEDFGPINITQGALMGMVGENINV